MNRKNRLLPAALAASLLALGALTSGAIAPEVQVSLSSDLSTKGARTEESRLAYHTCWDKSAIDAGRGDPKTLEEAVTAYLSTHKTLGEPGEERLVFKK